MRPRVPLVARPPLLARLPRPPGAVAAAVVVALLAVTSPAPSAAQSEGQGQEDPTGVTVRAVAGFEGRIASGRPYPVVVTVTTDRLLRATLQVELRDLMGSLSTLTREIEVAGGNSATYRFLASGSVADIGMPIDVGGEPGTVHVIAEEGADAVASAQFEIDSDPSEELVGVLPEAMEGATGDAAALPDAVPLLVDVGMARLAELDAEVVDLGALALAPLDQIVATPAELAALTDAQRAAVTAWVEAGGHLVLPGAAGDLDAATDVLPEGWLPEPGDGVRAGLGQVRAVSTSWSDELLPTPTRSAAEEELLAQDLIWANDSVSGSLSGDAGVRLPAAGRLGVMLALYVLVAGPVAYVLLRRTNRRQMAWAVLPVLAVSTTGMFVGTGGSLRRTASSAHVTVYESGPGGTVATTWSLVSNPRSRGEVGVRLPEGWAAVDSLDDWDGTGSPVEVRADGDGLQATTRPPAGGFGLIQSQGPVDGSTAGLVVTAESAADGVVRGTVRNDLDVELEEVAVLVGRGSVVDIGTLAPGAEESFEVEGTSDFVPQPDPERTVWPDENSTGNGNIDARGGFVIVEDGPARGQAIEPDVAPPEVLEPTISPAPAPDAVVRIGPDGARADDLSEDSEGPEGPEASEDPAGGDAAAAAGGANRVPAPGAADLPAGGDGAPGPGAEVAQRDAALAEAKADAEQRAAAQPPPPMPPMPPGGGGRPIVVGPDGRVIGEARLQRGESASVMSAWAAIMHRTGWNYRPTGQVVAVGWTEDLDAPVEATGSGRVARSRSAFVGRATVAPADEAGRVTDAAVVRSTVRGPVTEPRDDDENLPAVVAFDLPAAADESRLAIHLPGRFLTAEVWTPGGWVALPDVADGEGAEVDVPAGAVVGGQVFVRWTHPPEIPAPGRDLLLYEKESP